MSRAAIESTLVVPSIIESKKQVIARCKYVSIVLEDATTYYIDVRTGHQRQLREWQCEKSVTSVNMKDELSLSRCDAFVHRIVDAAIRLTQPEVDMV
jgi:hypothetical protein